MPKYEVFRVDGTPEDSPYTSLKCHYLKVEAGAYVFHDYNGSHQPELVLPISRFWVAKVED